MKNGLPETAEEFKAKKAEAIENYKNTTEGRALRAAEDIRTKEIADELKEKAKLKKIRFERIAKKAKKAAPYVAAPVVAAGIAYGGVKAAEGIKRKRSNEEIRRKVRGYDSSKKKS